jgi:hypothetical protein
MYIRVIENGGISKVKRNVITVSGSFGQLQTLLHANVFKIHISEP